jgi:acyl carrier protein
MYTAVLGVSQQHDDHEFGNLGGRMTDALIALFAEELDVEPSRLSDQSSPETVDTWDSLAAVRLVAAVESEFSVSLTARDIMRMRTIGIVREVLREKKIDI